jgi:hypothetical protein
MRKVSSKKNIRLPVMEELCLHRPILSIPVIAVVQQWEIKAL